MTRGGRLGFWATLVAIGVSAACAPLADALAAAAQGAAMGGGGALVGRWRFQKFGPVTGSFEFRPDGTYSYQVQDGRVRLAHEGTYQLRAPQSAASLPGLLGVVRLTPTAVVVDGAPTTLIIDHTLMDNHEAREYFVQDNLSPQHTQGIPTLALCDAERDWPGCAQVTRIYAAQRP